MKHLNLSDAHGDPQIIAALAELLVAAKGTTAEAAVADFVSEYVRPSVLMAR